MFLGSCQGHTTACLPRNLTPTPPSPVPHHHAPGLAWTSLAENPKVVDFFDVLSLSADRGGNVYVSTMEATYYPITATQWCAHSGGVITCWGV